jgi:hypothetical protein
MVFVAAAVIILILGGVLILALLLGVISLVMEKRTGKPEPLKKIKVSTVNQFENAVPERSDVIQ